MAQNLYPLGDYNTSQILEFVNMINQAKEFSENEKLDETLILYRRPDAAPNANDFIKTIPPNEAPFITPDAFAGKVGILLAANLSLSQLEAIGIDGDIYLKETIKANLIFATEDMPDNENVKVLRQYVMHSPAWQQ